MPVIKIPKNKANPDILRELIKKPVSFVYNSKESCYEYDVKSHNFINLDWERFLDLQKSPKIKTNLAQKELIRIPYDKEVFDKISILGENLKASNLAIIDLKHDSRDIKIEIREKLRNSFRAKQPDLFLKHIILELLWFCDQLEINFEYQKYKVLSLRIKTEEDHQKTKEITEIEDDESLVIINVSSTFYKNLTEKFNLSLEDKKIDFKIPYYLHTYKSYYKILINYLENQQGKARISKSNELSGSKKSHDFTLVENLGFEYHNICKLGSKKTRNSYLLRNPSGHKLRYYYPDVLEPLVQYFSEITRKIPKGYTIENNKVYLWLRKESKDDLTIKYLKKTILSTHEDSKILNTRESISYVPKNLPFEDSKYIINVLIDKNKVVKSIFLETKASFLFIDYPDSL